MKKYEQWGFFIYQKKLPFFNEIIKLSFWEQK